MKRGALVSAAATQASAQSDKLAKTKLRIRQSSPQLAPPHNSRRRAATRPNGRKFRRPPRPRTLAPLGRLLAARLRNGGALRQTRRRNKALRATLSFLRFDQN